MPKIRCVSHGKRIFINGETGTVSHRDNLANCETLFVKLPIAGQPEMSREKIIWLCDTRYPEHYMDIQR